MIQRLKQLTWGFMAQKIFYFYLSLTVLNPKSGHTTQKQYSNRYNKVFFDNYRLATVTLSLSSELASRMVQLKTIKKRIVF